MADVTANIPFNAIAFIEELIEKMQGDIDYAYPLSSYDEDRGHTALMMLQGKVEALRAFTNALDKQ